jgi:predicted nucleic acid-binding protein
MATTVFTSIEELKKKIARKWVIFDTNILIEGFEKNPNEFVELHKMLVGSHCAPAYIPMIEFEFLRGAPEAKTRSKRREILRELAHKYPVRSDSGLTESAIEIANVYESRKGPRPELVDCHIAAVLRQHPTNLFLATLNHEDYPTYLFNPLYVLPIETRKSLLPVGIYEWGVEKAASLGLQKTTR